MDPTDAQRLRRVSALLERALAVPAAELEAWIAALPPEHEPDLPLMRALLERAGVESDTFMRRPLAFETRPLAEDDQPGQAVGPWRLVERLGEGGMAVVWLAERTDGVPRRQVALKLPRAGWGTGLAQRLALERDILASLEHPGIAALYDAGVTAEGRPWLAMQRVQGQPIDVYCRERELPVRARVELVARVADAVAHAHSRLVVHRDLKPSNILVTPEGEVRLLDFGVAKLLEGDAQPASDQTQALGRAATPDYAAPEQVGGRPVSAATDVYSLGIVLHELLCGQRPYRMGAHASGPELEQAILHARVLPPSQCAGDDRRLARELRGDLDTVVGKTMRRRASDRYPSMESLAADLRRYLEGEAVLAQPPSRAYRARKFVRRHRLGLAAATITFAASTAGLAVALWQAREARHQAALAFAALERADAAFEFGTAVLAEGAGSDERITQAQLLDRAVGIAARSFNGDPVERSVATLAASEWMTRSGRRPEALQMLKETIDTLPAGTDPGVLTELRCHHAFHLVRLGRVAEGTAALDQALAVAPADLDPRVRVWCEHRRAAAAAEVTDNAAELLHMQRAAAVIDAVPRFSRSAQAHVLADLGGALWSGGRMLEGEQAFRRAFDLLRTVGRDGSQEALSARHNYGIELFASGQTLRALEIAESVVAIERRHSPSGRPALEVVLVRAEVLLDLWRHDEAFAAFGEVADAARGLGDLANVARALTGQALALQRQGRAAESEALAAQAARLIESPALGAGTRRAFAARQRLAELARLGGHGREADEAYANLGTDPSHQPTERMAEIWRARAEIALAEGRLDDARPLADSALAACRKRQGDLPFSLRTGRTLLVQAQLAQARGERDEARRAAEQAAEHIAATGGGDHPLAVQARRLAATVG